MVTIDRRQLFWLLQKRSENPDQLFRQSLRLSEEEHAGGAIAFASYDLGVRFVQEERLLPQNGLTFADVI
jgi:hypothetical protein